MKLLFWNLVHERLRASAKEHMGPRVLRGGKNDFYLMPLSRLGSGDDIRCTATPGSCSVLLTCAKPLGAQKQGRWKSFPGTVSALGPILSLVEARVRNPIASGPTD